MITLLISPLRELFLDGSFVLLFRPLCNVKNSIIYQKIIISGDCRDSKVFVLKAKRAGFRFPAPMEKAW